MELLSVSVHEAAPTRHPESKPEKTLPASGVPVTITVELRSKKRLQS